MTPTLPPRVLSASIVSLRLYDVAYEIDLDHAERLASVLAPTARPRLARTKPKSIAYGVAPVEISLGSAPLRVVDQEFAAEITARLFAFGTVSIAARIAVQDIDWSPFSDLVRVGDRALREGDWPGWSHALERVREVAGPALVRPSAHSIEEDYLITTVHRFDREVRGIDVPDHVDLPALLARETQALSEPARRELLRQTFTYYPGDLAVLTWDHAFLVEPGGDTEIADVLEVANARLLELRYYHAQLDDELPRMYERVESARTRLGFLQGRRYANLARELHARVAEVTEIAERVDSALIVTEDIYLARIYGAAIELFRVRAWNAAVDRKLAIVRDTYTALYDEAATMRAELLEAGILLLIVFEIVMAFF